MPNYYRLILLLNVTLPVIVFANPQCTHLGGPVICPDGITPGSESVFFTPSGIQWSDGNESMGQNPAPFVACPPPLSGGTGSPTDPFSGLGVEPDDDRSLPASIEEQLGLTQNPQPKGPQSPRTNGIAPVSSQTPPSVVITNGNNQIPLTQLNLPASLSSPGLSSVAPITGSTYIPENKTPSYLNDAPPAGSRESILKQFRGSGDIAGAIEALALENALDYDQATPEDINRIAQQAAQSNPLGPSAKELKEKMAARFAGTATNDELIHVTRANCYETVHLAAWFAGSGDGAMPQTQGGLRPLINPETKTEWDGESVPRGKIIVGTTSERMGGQDEFGFYHVAVSLGNGYVANNHGSGIQIEKIEDVFGGAKGVFLYEEIYIGDYDGYKLPDSGREFFSTVRDDNNQFMDFANNAQDLEIQDYASTEDRVAPLDEAKQKLQSEVASAEGQNKIIEAALGLGPYPNQTMTDEMADYSKFVSQVMDGITQNKPFFYTNFEAWQATQTSTDKPKTPTQTAASPPYEPPTPNQGYEEMSKFFVQAFGMSEAAGLATPKPR